LDQGLDAGIRLGDSIPQDMIAIDISPRQRFAVLGSPGYFADRPAPLSPLDLSTHDYA
jgi:DNA-binding transcriptional LysR family regulator